MSEKAKIIGVPGRLAFTQPTGGVRVPHDKPITVTRTPWIDKRLADGDIALFTEKRTKPEPAPAAPKIEAKE